MIREAVGPASFEPGLRSDGASGLEARGLGLRPWA